MLATIHQNWKKFRRLPGRRKMQSGPLAARKKSLRAAANDPR
jgi:hypothetical protein